MNLATVYLVSLLLGAHQSVECCGMAEEFFFNAMSFLPRMTMFLPMSFSHKSCDNVSVDEFPNNHVTFILLSFCSESCDRQFFLMKLDSITRVAGYLA